MAVSRVLSRPSRRQVALALVAALALAALAGFVLHEIGVAHVKSLLLSAKAWCATVNPLLFVLIFAIMPYVGVPTSALYVLAGSAYGPWRALGWCWLGLLLNIILGYLIGSWLRGPISRWLERQGRKLPDVPSSETWKLILLTRILPGPPLVVQNLLLAVAGVPFPIYLLISFPVQMLFGFGFVFTGGAIFSGSTGLLITGVCALVALTLLAHVVKTMYEARRKAAATAGLSADATPRPPA
jgi:uncharacterized membrane protein YdjX (TVP38/TMEM64 family)